jgi:hypothetical protein
MPLRGLLCLVLGPLALALNAQLLPQDIPNSDLGWPARPPFITFLGIGSQGKMAVDPSARPAGPVAAVTFEELRVRGDGTTDPKDLSYSTRTRFDEQGRPTEEVRTERETQATTISTYEPSHILSREYTFVRPGKPAQPKGWEYWKYDVSGRLADFRAGRGDALQNHYTNFKRDTQGHLTSVEYRQGAKDEPQLRTEFEYSPDGQTVKTIEYGAGGAPFRSVTEILDPKGRVSQATIEETDWRTKKPKPALRVAFSYDEQGRLTEQATDLYKPEQSEHELPPGKVSLTYDDAKHTRTVSYFGDEGWSLSSTIVLDSTGATVAQTVQSAGEGTSTVLDMKLECTFDDHGNWTRCQRWASTADNRKMTGAWRRTIEYRPVEHPSAPGPRHP